MFQLISSYCYLILESFYELFANCEIKISPPFFFELKAEDISQKEFHVADSQRSKTSVVASLAAAGYTVGEDALTKAKAYDEKHMITLQVISINLLFVF